MMITEGNGNNLETEEVNSANKEKFCRIILGYIGYNKTILITKRAKPSLQKVKTAN